MQRSLVLGGLFALAAGCAGHAGRVVAQYEAGDFAGAARTADTELAAHPGDEALWQMRIRAALALGDAAGVATTYAAYRTRLDGDDDLELLRDLAIATLGQALTAPSVKLKIAAIEAIEAAELEPLADQVAQRMRDDDDRSGDIEPRHQPRDLRVHIGAQRGIRCLRANAGGRNGDECGACGDGDASSGERVHDSLEEVVSAGGRRGT